MERLSDKKKNATNDITSNLLVKAFLLKLRMLCIILTWAGNICLRERS